MEWRNSYGIERGPVSCMVVRTSSQNKDEAEGNSPVVMMDQLDTNKRFVIVARCLLLLSVYTERSGESLSRQEMPREGSCLIY